MKNSTALIETSRKKCKSAFSLVELLIVMAILAILVSLLSPALRKAMSTAQSISCASNLKQTGHACLLYSEDFNHWTPPTYEALPGTKDIRSWMSKLYLYGYIIEPKAGMPTVLLCPSGEPSVWYDVVASGTHSYAYGNTIPGVYSSWNLSQSPIRAANGQLGADTPSKLILFADSALTLPGNSGFGLQRYFIVNVPYSESRIMLRHVGNANIFVGDGHVAGLDRFDLQEEYGWTNTCE